MKTFRWIEWINGTFVKLEIQDGARMEWSEGGPSDEGYHYENYSIERHGSELLMRQYINAQDCDGRMSQDRSYLAHIPVTRNSTSILNWERITGAEYYLGES